MKNLFIFLWKYNFLILFLSFEGLCGYLIIQNNNFQRASFVNSSNRVAAEINLMVRSFTDYISLRMVNDALSRENAGLRNLYPDAFRIDSAINRLVHDTIFHQQYSFLTARVVNNSVNRRNNYLTLNKGSKQGVKPEMGVICSDGIVGIVKDVSENFCSVMSFLHKDSRYSARIKKSGYIGSLVWDGYDAQHASLNEIAKHVKVEKGDTLVSSSFSAIFPEGVLIGFVEKVNSDTPDNFQEITIRLSTPFNKLVPVYIVSNLLKDEQRALEGLNVHDP